MSAFSLGFVGGVSSAPALNIANFFASTLTSAAAGTTIPLPFAPNMDWHKVRGASQDHRIWDRDRSQNFIAPNSTAAQASNASQGLPTTMAPSSALQTYAMSGSPEVIWSWKTVARFFEQVLSYSGNDVAGRRRALNTLAIKPGLFVVKRTVGAASDWYVYHISLGATKVLFLNSTAAAVTSTTAFNNTEPDATGIYLGLDLNASGSTYVGYAFAHDPSPSGVIQCGSFTTNGSGVGSYSHGWAQGAQFALIKASSTTGDWEMFDIARSPSWTTDLRIRPNLPNAEDTVTRISDSGGTMSFVGLSASATYVCMLNRAP